MNSPQAMCGGEATPEPEEAPPIDLAGFWHTPPHSEEIALHFALPEADAVPVKRLGPPQFVRDRAAFTSAMERIYAHIGQYALVQALGDADVSS